jgi:hypothetical protein
MTKRAARNEDWQADAGKGQQNVLPLDAARNEGRFLGKILLGTGPLSIVQRIGTIVLAVPVLAGGLGTLGLLLKHLDRLQLVDPIHSIAGTIGNLVTGLLVLLFLAVSLFVGFRLVLKAIRAPHAE